MPNKVYHAFNRGVEGRTIFRDDRDFRTFLYFLKFYLSSPEKLKEELPLISTIQNLYGKISLLSYCLMPNHFHLLVSQKEKDAMTKLLRRVSVSYSNYFNNRYRRNGVLFQGVYKAVMAESLLEILIASRYVNLNPIIEKIDDDYKIVRGKNIEEAINYPYSSMSCLLGRKNADWVNSGELLQNLNFCPGYQNLTYLEFVRKTELGGGRFVDY